MDSNSTTTGLLLGDPEVTANLYYNFAYPYWEGCVICSIYLRQLLGHPVLVHMYEMLSNNVLKSTYSNCLSNKNARGEKRGSCDNVWRVFI